MFSDIMNNESSIILLHIDKARLLKNELDAITDGIYALEEKREYIKDKRNSILTLSKLYLPEFDDEEKNAITDAIYALCK